VRPARPLPYTLHVDGRVSESSFRIDFNNFGRAAAVFQVRSAGSAEEPRSYTVEPGKHLSDTWDIRSGYDLSVHGPNGFFRQFTGGAPTARSAQLDVGAAYNERHDEIALKIRNRGPRPVSVIVRSGYSSRQAKLSLKPGESVTEQWSLSRTRGWYDLVLTVAGGAPVEYRYAGHLENGEESITDPAMGGLV
jgi:phospholipase C